LGPDDRFVGIIRLAISRGMEYDKFLEAMSYAFFFRATDENGLKSEPDILFDQTLSKGLNYALEQVCGFDAEKDKKLIEKLGSDYLNLKAIFQKIQI
jgi:mannitol-1-phosphate 5-dehydrogenase